MKIERDKFYRTRSGQKVRIVFTELPGKRPIIAIAGGLVLVLYPNGVYSDDGNSTFDLIAEWIDLPVIDWSKMAAWHRWVVMNTNGNWYSVDVKPYRNHIKQAWLHDGNSLRIPPEFAPKWTGDWRQSLCERPTE